MHDIFEMAKKTEMWILGEKKAQTLEKSFHVCMRQFSQKSNISHFKSQKCKISEQSALRAVTVEENPALIT